MGAEVIHTEGRTDKHEKATVAFRNFANAHKTVFFLTCRSLQCVSFNDFNVIKSSYKDGVNLANSESMNMESSRIVEIDWQLRLCG
jgi:hypothetical protein